MNQYKKMFRELKGPYSIIGKNGEYYEVDDISTLYPTFGGMLSFFFTFTMENFLKSKPRKVGDADFSCFDHSFILYQISKIIVDDNKNTPSKYDVIASMGTDLLTHFNSTVVKEVGASNKRCFNHKYFLIKHKYAYNEFSYIPDTTMTMLLKQVALHNFQGFSFYFDMMFLGKTNLLSDNGNKRKRHRSLRSFSTLQEKRWNIAHADEYGEYLVRGKRRAVPDSRDDYKRTFQRTWKNGKIRYQWMKNLKKHADTGILDNTLIEDNNQEV